MIEEETLAAQLAALGMGSVESKEEVKEVEVKELTEYQVQFNKLHEELAALADGRTEDSIGLSEPYWTKLNELRQFIHRNK